MVEDTPNQTPNQDTDNQTGENTERKEDKEHDKEQDKEIEIEPEIKEIVRGDRKIKKLEKIVKKDLTNSSELMKDREIEVAEVKDLEKEMKKFFSRKKRKCSNRCPIYPCWAINLVESEYQGRCALANLSPLLKKATIDMIKNGEVGLIEEMVRTLLDYKYRVMKEPTPKNYKDYIFSLVSTKKSIWGTKALIEIRREEDKTKELIDGLKVAFDVIDLKKGKDYEILDSKVKKKADIDQIIEEQKDQTQD